jgi:predicted nucleotidyltransferase
LEERLEIARKDFDRIVDHIARTYRPKRIWQWGSLIDGHHFSERSDIDIAIEGIEDPNRNHPSHACGLDPQPGKDRV